MFKGFKQFILRGNVIDLAVGVVIGAAFNTVVNSLVKGLLTPFIAAIVKIPDFSNFVVTINGGKFLIGELVNSAISFLLVAAAVYFFVVLPMNSLMSRVHSHDAPADPSTKKCPECMSEIPKNARRCAFCTSQLASA